MEKIEFAVIDLNNPDPVEQVWVKFDTEKAASEWIKNYNDNARRKRNFDIKQIIKS